MNLNSYQNYFMLLANQLAVSKVLLPLLLIGAASASLTPLPSSSEDPAEFLATFTSRALVRVWPGFKQHADYPKGCFEIEEAYDRRRKLGKLVVNIGGERSELYVRANDKLYLEAHFSQNGTLKQCTAAQLRPESRYFEMFGQIAQIAERQQTGGELNYFIGPSALIYLFRNQLDALWNSKQAYKLAANKTATDSPAAAAAATSAAAKAEVEVEEEQEQKEERKKRRLFVEQEAIELSLLEDRNLKVSFKLASSLLDRSPLLARLAPYMSFTDSQDQTYQVDFLSIEENLIFNFSDINNSKDPFHLSAGGFLCASTKLVDEKKWKNFDETKKKEEFKTEQQRRVALLPTGISYQLTAEDSWMTSWPNWANRMELISNQMWAKIYSLPLYPEGVELALDSERHRFQFVFIGHSKNVLELRKNLIFHLPDEPLVTQTDIQDKFHQQSSSFENENNNENNNVRQAINSECSILTGNELFGEITSLAREGHASYNSLKKWHFFVGNTNSMMYLGRVQHKPSGHLAHEFELSYSKADELPALFMSFLANDWREIKLEEEGSSLFLGAKLYILANSCPVDLYEMAYSCSNPVFLAFKLELIDLETMTLQRSEEIPLNEFHWTLSEASSQDEVFVGAQPSESQLFDLSRCPWDKIEIQFEVRWMETISMVVENEDEENSSEKFGEGAAASSPPNSCKLSGMKGLDKFVADQWAIWVTSYFGPDSSIVRFDRHSIAGTQVARYSVELAEAPKQVLSFVPVSSHQELSANPEDLPASIEALEVDQIGARIGAELVAQTKDARTLFECLTWASQSIVGQIVLRSVGGGTSSECLLFEKKREEENTGRLAANNSEQCSQHSSTAIGGDEAMLSDENYENSPPQQQQQQQKGIGNLTATRYNVYVRKVGQPKSLDSQKRISNYEGLFLMNKAIRERQSVSNNFQACLEPTKYARDIRFGLARLAPEAAGQLERGNDNSGQFAHKRGYRFALQANISASADSLLSPLAREGWQRTQARALEEVKSFAQCSIGCDEEPSCASFAFCDYPESGHQYCQLSSIRLRDKSTSSSSPDVVGNTNEKPNDERLANDSSRLVRDANCDIRAKDYLLYFQPTDLSNLASELGWRLVAKDQSQLECASACYSALETQAAATAGPSESCLRFVHCQGLNWCFHRIGGEFVAEPEQQTRATKNALDTFISNPELLSSCAGFKRKALSLYRKTLSHVDHDWLGEGLFQAKVVHVSKMFCAEKCTLDTECQSFDECRVVMTHKQPAAAASGVEGKSSSSSSSQASEYVECVLLGGSIYDSQADNAAEPKLMSLANSSIASETYAIRRHCDHYERLAAKQRLSAKQVDWLIERANLPSELRNSGDNTDLSEQADEASSYATILFCAALIGLGAGLLAQSFKFAWLDRAKRLSGGGVANGSRQPAQTRW